MYQHQSAHLDTSPNYWSPSTQGTNLYFRKDLLLALKPLFFSSSSLFSQVLLSSGVSLCDATVPPKLPQTRGCPPAGTVALWLWSSLPKRTGCTRMSASRLAPFSSSASSSHGETQGSPAGKACGILVLPAQVPPGSPYLEKHTRIHVNDLHGWFPSSWMKLTYFESAVVCDTQ